VFIYFPPVPSLLAGEDCARWGTDIWIERFFAAMENPGQDEGEGKEEKGGTWGEGGEEWGEGKEGGGLGKEGRGRSRRRSIGKGRRGSCNRTEGSQAAAACNPTLRTVPRKGAPQEQVRTTCSL